MTKVTNDNDKAAERQKGPDAHGQAAMLLVESLIHGLVERKVITVADAIEIVDIAADVKAEIAIDLDDSQEALQKSLNLLKAISHSVEADREMAAPPIER